MTYCLSTRRQQVSFIIILHLVIQHAGTVICAVTLAAATRAVGYYTPRGSDCHNDGSRQAISSQINIA